MRKVYRVLDNKLESPVLPPAVKPAKGMQVMANIHPDYAPGTLLGIVQHVKGYTCTYIKADGSKDMIRWTNTQKYGFSAYVAKLRGSNYLRLKKRHILNLLDQE
jgi:hypothetical protein